MHPFKRKIKMIKKMRRTLRISLRRQMIPRKKMKSLIESHLNLMKKSLRRKNLLKKKKRRRKKKRNPLRPKRRRRSHNLRRIKRTAALFLIPWYKVPRSNLKRKKDSQQLLR